MIARSRRSRAAAASRLFSGLWGAAALASVPAGAIWSDDPALNLVVADGASEQVQPKVVALADGGFYVSWFDNATGGYDVRLQRLSASGVELWPHNGILVADRSLSSTTDYGLSVDAAGNALLAFNDDSQPTERIVVSKISPAGVALWGTPGIAVSDSKAFLASPRVAGTDDGEVVVAWFQSPDTVLQRLDPSGTALCAAGWIALAPSAYSSSMTRFMPRRGIMTRTATQPASRRGEIVADSRPGEIATAWSTESAGSA